MGRLQTIVQVSGSILMLLGGLLLVPLIFALAAGESPRVLMAFGIAALISFASSLLSFLITRNHTPRMDLGTSMVFCSLAWLVISIVGSIPYYLILELTFIDALFEAVSGFTTTGITILQGLDTLSQSLLFWRSFTQWLGGLGILTFFLFVTTNAEGDVWQLFSAEGHKISSARPVPNVYKTIRWFWIIYGGYSVILFFILRFLGLSWFDALNHALTTLSTGGFSTHDASVGYYEMAGYVNYRIIEYTFIFFMFLGGLNFLIHYKTLRENPLAFFQDKETKAYTQIITLFTMITIIGVVIARGLPLAEIEITLRKTLFQIVSLMTSTGFGTEDIGSTFFPVVTKQLFILLMVVGGCVGSTAGGFKVLRVVVLRRLLYREIHKLNLPSKAVLPVTIDGIIINHEEIMRIAALAFGWLLLIFVGSAITALFSDLGPFEAFSGMTSAVGNMGPFYFSVAKMASLSWIVKLTYIVGMLAGRLELLPIYILLVKSTWR